MNDNSTSKDAGMENNDAAIAQRDSLIKDLAEGFEPLNRENQRLVKENLSLRQRNSRLDDELKSVQRSPEAEELEHLKEEIKISYKREGEIKRALTKYKKENKNPEKFYTQGRNDCLEKILPDVNKIKRARKK